MVDSHNRLLGRLVVTFWLVMAGVSGVHAATLVHQYDFTGDLTDSLGNGDPLTEFNTNSSGFGADGWSWTASSNPGGGLVLVASLADPANYSLGFRISYQQVSPSWRKIVSFKGTGDDNGLYYYNANLQYYPFGANIAITFSTNTFYDFIFSRSSASGGTMMVYVVEQDGTLTKVYEEADAGGASIPVSLGGGEYEFRLFMDDTTTDGEWTSGGTVKTVRVWDGPLAEEEVGGALEPEPSAATPVPGLSNYGLLLLSLLLGLAALAGTRLRSRA